MQAAASPPLSTPYPARLEGHLLSLIAFVALPFGGRYRYPPFTLADAVDYPARLEVAYPERQRHRLPPIGWPRLATRSGSGR